MSAEPMLEAPAAVADRPGRAGAVLAGAGLLGFAAFIWLRDTQWMTGGSDTLPVLCALPLFFYLGMPWRWRTGPARPLRRGVAAAAGFCALAGVVGDLTFALALAWCGALWLALEHFMERIPARLLPLPLLAFPWLALDLPSLGWNFRLTGAAAAAVVFQALGFETTREGTLLSVQGMPLSVDPACAGLNVLQALLIAGTVLVWFRMRGWRYFASLACLPLLAWVANVIRIVALGLSGLSFGADFAMGWFHQWGGWVVLCVMWLLSQSLLTVLGRARTTTA